jgi:hypothetical protein
MIEPIAPALVPLAEQLAHLVRLGRLGPAVVGVPAPGTGPPEVRPLGDDHPADALAGRRAPRWWEAVAVVATGTAAGPGPVRRRVVVATATSRAGDDHSLVVDRRGRPVVSGPGVEGLVPDAARRFLGVATPPPAVPVTHWWAAEWLIDVAGLATLALRPLTLAQVVACHPAMEPDEALDPGGDVLALTVQRGWDHAHLTGWDGVRSSVADGLLTDGACPAPLARWFDAGSFCRHALAHRPDPRLLLDHLAPVLAPGVAPAVGSVLDRWRIPPACGPGPGR